MLHKIAPKTNLLIHLKDPRSVKSRFQDLWISIQEEITSRNLRKSNPLRACKDQLFPKLQKEQAPHLSLRYDTTNQPWIENKDSEKLALFIHGLNSSPLSFSLYLEELKKRSHTTSYFIPYVHQKGYSKLSEAADPILDVAQTYAHLYPKNPIFLIGHSNGARIASYIEKRLKANNIHLLSIAGPHGGSIRFKVIKALRLSSFFHLPEEITQELSYLSSFATDSLIEWQTQANNIEDRKISRLFFATADDWRVFPSKTCFPKLPNSSYYLISKASHVTILEKTLPFILSYIESNDQNLSLIHI